MNPVDQIIQKYEGKVTKAAEAIGVSYQLLQDWKKRRIPAERLIQIERATGIPRHELRPDLYAPEAAG